MERDINRQQSESLVREIRQERERFVSAIERGASAPELNKIREYINHLNELLWESTLQKHTDHESSRPTGGFERDSQNRASPFNGRP